MKRTLFATVVCLAFTGTSAIAEGLPGRGRVTEAPPTVYNWTGFYIGGHAGGAWGDSNLAFTGQNNILVFGDPGLGSHDVSGAVAGGQIGFNWQAPGSNWVLGIEGQASWSNADGERSVPYPGSVIRGLTEVEWLGTVAGRVGYAFDRTLVYATGGFAFAHVNYEMQQVVGANVARFPSDEMRTGWTVGGGIEVALDGGWSLKGEYNYMDFGTEDVKLAFPGGLNAFGRFDIDQQIHVAKIGINYRFGTR